jgi:hypothetical protein
MGNIPTILYMVYTNIYVNIKLLILVLSYTLPDTAHLAILHIKFLQKLATIRVVAIYHLVIQNIEYPVISPVLLMFLSLFNTPTSPQYTLVDRFKISIND